jgi:hypothetical protein
MGRSRLVECANCFKGVLQSHQPAARKTAGFFVPKAWWQVFAAEKCSCKAIETIKNIFKYSIECIVSIKENSYRNI